MQNKMNNFLNPKLLRHKKKFNFNYKKFLLIFGIILGAIILIGGSLYLIYKKPIVNAYHGAISGKDNFKNAQDKLQAQDFEGAKISLNSAISNFQTSKHELSKLNWVKFLPWIGTQLKAIDNVLDAGLTTGQAIVTIDDLAIQILQPITKNNDISLSTLSPQETRNLLKNIYDAKPQLEQSKKTIDTAVDFINKIPKKGVLKKINLAIEPIKNQVPQLQSAIDQAISASQIIPTIAGYPDQKTYLFLLQNNTEMRPTGGFIGTYGILKVKDGDINSFSTDNTYNLDVPAEAWLSVEPPTPLTRYNDVHRWFLRDANWSPDFPTTAQKAEWFYTQERGPEKQIDGIIAVTPTFIQSLLSVTGDIKVNGINFTSTNLVDTLQYQVEQGFLRQGIEQTQRKEIIGSLSTKILDEVLALPKSKWTNLWQVFNKDITEKQILLYLKDNYIQNLILKENWGGGIQNVAYDFVGIVDANLASLKSDPHVQRSYSYTIRRDGQNIVADLSIKYDNQNSITWKTTRYRTYTRVYVPAGSVLLTSSGAMIDCKITKPGSVETSQELDKTVFGAFICIEPGENGELNFKYKLPLTITNQLLKENYYQVLFRKQPGAADYNLEAMINLKRKPLEVSGLDNIENKADNTVQFQTTLSQDKLIKITF